MVEQQYSPFMKDDFIEKADSEEADAMVLYEKEIIDILSDPKKIKETLRMLDELQADKSRNFLVDFTPSDLFSPRSQSLNEGLYEDMRNLAQDRKQVDISLLGAALRISLK